MMSSKPSFRAAFAWRKPPASVSRFCLTTSAPAAPNAIFNWQRRSWPMNKAPDKQRKALGKGLSALLPTKAPDPSAHAAPASDGVRVATIPILQIEPNHLQPRTTFDPGRLQELANSIQTNGIIQPLIVRRKG